MKADNLTDVKKYLIELFKALNEVEGEVKYPIVTLLLSVLMFFFKKKVNKDYPLLKNIRKMFRFKDLKVQLDNGKETTIVGVSKSKNTDPDKDNEVEQLPEKGNTFVEQYPKFDYVVKDLVKHDLFREIRNLIGDTDPEFITHGQRDYTKDIVYRDFINNKLQSTHDNMIRIASEYTEGMLRADLKNHVYNMFDDCNNCLEMRLIDTFVSKRLSEKGRTDLTREEEKLISKLHAERVYRKFIGVRDNTMRRYGRIIEKIFSNPFNETNFQCINQLFTVVLWEMDDIMEDSVKTFESINGDFLNLEYKEMF